MARKKNKGGSSTQKRRENSTISKKGVNSSTQKRRENGPISEKKINLSTQKRRENEPVENVEELKKVNNIHNYHSLIENMKKGVLYVPAKPFIPEVQKGKWYQWKKNKAYKRHKALLENHKEKSVLVRMEMDSGRFSEFIVSEDEGYFMYNKSMYIFDLEQKYYIISRDIWAYDYHQSMSLPIRKKMILSDAVSEFLDKIEDAGRNPMPPSVEVNDIKKIVENSGLIDVEASLNPTTLKRFTDSEVIKQVLQGAMLGKIFKLMFIFIIIIGILVLLMFFTDLYHAGVFDKIKGALKK